MPNHSGDFVYLKTTASVLYRDTQYSIAEYGDIQQAAMIMEGARALGMVANSFTLLWVDSDKPHCVRAQTLKDEDLARGHKLNGLAGRVCSQFDEKE
ncbi:hypothetical protein [Bradyrhizobium icense]|uniref:Uncharacterized protein n=1 Tax=Bradyrhizobium icense TaxID=1274631 RepID=A0A1B1UKD2_9BRAD|nr:hypothetical protein [Bradyrhizobium icense]ANW03279.1 hypothetical protein LMTR13_27215 [Bradyrhizobium icense]